jgi:hypothetical protein
MPPFLAGRLPNFAQAQQQTNEATIVLRINSQARLTSQARTIAVTERLGKKKRDPSPPSRRLQSGTKQRAEIIEHQPKSDANTNNTRRTKKTQNQHPTLTHRNSAHKK